ncbi:hypothetical protein T439DRAFT_328056 [Meredithblackwellia eburnea MCA 4105]
MSSRFNDRDLRALSAYNRASLPFQVGPSLSDEEEMGNEYYVTGHGHTNHHLGHNQSGSHQPVGPPNPAPFERGWEELRMNQNIDLSQHYQLALTPFSTVLLLIRTTCTTSCPTYGPTTWSTCLASSCLRS